MKKGARHYLIPHKSNNYKPKLFDYSGLSFMLAVAILVFIGSVSANKIATKVNTEGASVYSSVLIDLTNDARAKDGRPTLTVSSVLNKAALMKAEDMAQKHYFAHTSPEGVTPWHWFEAVGYRFAYAGENLAVDFTESEDVENAWLASPSHRENILDARFQEVGMAVKEGMLDGKQTTFVVQLFGATPVLSAPPVPKKELPPVTKPTTIPTTMVAIADTPGTTLGAHAMPIEVITENAESIVVKNPNEVPITAAANTATESYASSFDKILVAMPSYGTNALLALAAFIVVGLLLFIFIEIRRQHPTHIALGVLLLVIVVGLAYASKSYLLPIPA